eukprot:CAMPEP_0204821612 /NCGR_PEP_ID=MMETSP1018-20131115/35794_1 /ASSEMBLY_ACC=CAM_ASM_000518 /TAXON_ID=46462 /ORGANISM="Anophryoides haemophila, Strain AH6" /LENGTH=172 /DNA_ID=CAMNT_0051937909 /DNA_START=30 /DNA_END=548 /DNA_ORIENTATION=+
MKIFQDIFSNEEIVADSYTFNGEVCFNECAVKVKSKLVAVGDVDIDVGCGNAFGGDKEEEGAGDNVEKVIDLVDTYRYQETSFGKKDYVTYIKGYMKRLKAKLSETKPERVEGFMKGAAELVQWVVKNFDEFTFYLPESYDTENIIILSYYDGEDAAPTFVYFLDGLKGILV